MTDTFADTSGWAAVANRRDAQHAAAMSIVTALSPTACRFVTTSSILAELTALLTARRVPKSAQIQFFTDLRSDPRVEIVHVGVTLDAAAWHLWESRPDKTWSLVDCASFEVMRARGLTDALTSDHHFEQAGFVRLLK